MMIRIILDKRYRNPTVTRPRWWLMTTATGYNMASMGSPNRTALPRYNMAVHNNDRGVRCGNAYAITTTKNDGGTDPKNATIRRHKRTHFVRAYAKAHRTKMTATTRRHKRRFTRVGRPCRTKTERKGRSKTTHATGCYLGAGR
jgi:hypothetical protein